MSRSRAVKGRKAFSVIELVGVLAIIAILAAATVPVVIRQVDQAARTKERIDLASISNALVLQILSTKSIPREANLALAAAAWTTQPATRILNTPRGYRRAFLVDTNGFFGIAAGNLPYTQSVTGSTNPPTNARLMIVSTIAQTLPVVTGRPGNTVFNDLWITPDGLKPNTAPWTTWPGKGEDLIVQRMNLDQIFHRLVVINRDRFGATAPLMAIDSASTNVPTGTGRNAFFFDGSVVGLCDSAATPMKRFTLNKDMGYVFEGGIWREGISGGDSSDVLAQDFAALANQFIAAQWYPGAEQGGRTGDQQGALNAMFNFMLVFELWANPFPHFPKHGASSATQVPEYVLLQDLAGSGGGINAGGFLNEFTGPNGLLNENRK